MTDHVRRLLPWVQALWGIMAAAALNRRLVALSAAGSALCLAVAMMYSSAAHMGQHAASAEPGANRPLAVWQQASLFLLGLAVAWPLGRRQSASPPPASPVQSPQNAVGQSTHLSAPAAVPQMPAPGALLPLPQGAQSLLAILARALGQGEVALFIRQEGRLVCRAQEPAPFGAQALAPRLMALVKKGTLQAHLARPVPIDVSSSGRTQSIAVPLQNSHEAGRFHSGPQKLWAVLVAQRQRGHLTAADRALAASVAEQIAMSLSLEQALRHAQADKLRLEHMATTDGLTELANRRHFMRIFDLQLARAKRYNRVLSLIFLDIDHFKQVNDTFGHAQGDEVLKKVAQILRLTARKTDTVARYGGEEFAILMEETGTAGARRIAERIQEALKKHAFGEPHAHFYKTVSIGVACFPEHGDNPERLIACADDALYQAKRNGRNQITLYLGPKGPLESEPR